MSQAGAARRRRAVAPVPGAPPRRCDRRGVRARLRGAGSAGVAPPRDRRAARAVVDASRAAQTLVLCIDDLQWGDADSALLLADILRPPDAPPLLALLSYRSDEAANAPILQALHAQRAAGALGEVRELRDRRARARRGARARRRGARHVASTRRMPPRSRPSPVARRSSSASSRVTSLAGAPTGAAVSLDEVLAFRIGQLPEDARALLSVVAVAGHPVPQSVAVQSAELQGDPLAALAELRRQHMIRAVGLRETDTHRDLSRSDPRVGRALARRRSRCAASTRASRAPTSSKGDVDPEILVEHWRGAGRLNRAGDHAAVAAEQASQRVRVRSRGAPLSPRARARRTAGRRSPADARAARRGTRERAAAVPRRPKPSSPPPRARTPPTRSSCVAAPPSAGCTPATSIRASTRSARCSRPSASRSRRPRARALGSLLSRRLWLRLRGLGYKRRDPTQVATEVLTRIDILRSVATGLSMIDVIHGADFNTRHLLAALRAGEPHRVARALAVESAHSSTGGGKTQTRTLALAAAATALATRARGSARDRARQGGLGDRCVLARRVARRARSLPRGRADPARLDARHDVGVDVGAVVRPRRHVLPRRAARADRGRAREAPRGRGARQPVVRDRPAQLAHERRVARARRSRRGAPPGRARPPPVVARRLPPAALLRAARARSDRSLRRQRPRRPRAHRTTTGSALAGSLLLRVQNIRVEAQHLRARCALAEAKASGDLAAPRHRDKAAHTIRRERMPWALAIAQARRRERRRRPR